MAGADCFWPMRATTRTRRRLPLSERYPAQGEAGAGREIRSICARLASIYQAQGRSADAQRVLAQALALPYPDNGTSLKTDTKLQYAGILMEAKRYDQAAALYTQIVNEDRNNLSAWMGLVSAHHELGQDTQAIADVQKMPPATYESALGDPGFLSMLGAIYQQANQLEVAQGLLERSAKLQMAAGGQPSVALAIAIGRHLPAAQQHRAGVWHLQPGAARPIPTAPMRGRG